MSLPLFKCWRTGCEDDHGHGDERADHHDHQQGDGDALPVPLRRADVHKLLQTHTPNTHAQINNHHCNFTKINTTLHSTDSSHKSANEVCDVQRRGPSPTSSWRGRQGRGQGGARPHQTTQREDVNYSGSDSCSCRCKRAQGWGTGLEMRGLNEGKQGWTLQRRLGNARLDQSECCSVIGSNSSKLGLHQISVNLDFTH